MVGDFLPLSILLLVLHLALNCKVLYGSKLSQNFANAKGALQPLKQYYTWQILLPSLPTFKASQISHICKHFRETTQFMLTLRNDDNPTNTIDVDILQKVTHGMRGHSRLKVDGEVKSTMKRLYGRTTHPKKCIVQRNTMVIAPRYSVRPSPKCNRSTVNSKGVTAWGGGGKLCHSLMGSWGVWQQCILYLTARTWMKHQSCHWSSTSWTCNVLS